MALLLAAVAAVGWSVLTAPAQGPEERGRRLDAELRCPVCQGVSIADSPSPLAAQMRSLVRERIAGGATDEEVRAVFVERYGRWILLSPTTSGPDIVLWLAPGFVILTGSAVLVVLRRRRSEQVSGSDRAAVPARPPSTMARWAVLLVVAGAVAVPLAVALGVRSPGAEITGRPVGQVAALSLAELESRAAARPEDGALLTALAQAYLEAERLPEAMQRFQQVLLKRPDDIPALLGAAQVLIAGGRPDAAIGVLDRVVRDAPEVTDALLYRAIARAALEGPSSELARADARRFLESAPNDGRSEIARELLEPAIAPSMAP